MKAVTHPAPVRTRDRLLDAAAALIAGEGWAAVTMGKLAADVGVSRQTVYNELGSKAELAEALLLRETERFAERVGEVVAAHPGRPVDGVTAAFRQTIEAARVNPLLLIALGCPKGGRDDFLPLLTTRPEGVLERSVDTVAVLFARCYPEAGLSPVRGPSPGSAFTTAMPRRSEPTSTRTSTAPGPAWRNALVRPSWTIR